MPVYEGVVAMAGPPFPMRKVAIYCCLAYLSTHYTIPGPEKCAGWLNFCSTSRCKDGQGEVAMCGQQRS
eukprot:1146895-Pelagomonas_calceolata.AAC.1